MTIQGRMRGCLVGLAAGDAVGTTVEFQERGSFEPVTEMIGGGPFGLRPGQWTDDTSLALCLASSLVERGGFDPQDQMQRYGRLPQQHRPVLRHRRHDAGCPAQIHADRRTVQRV